MSDGNEFYRNDAATGKLSVDWQFLAGMVAQAVGLTMLTVDGDVWAGRRYEPADSGMIARDHVCLQTMQG